MDIKLEVDDRAVKEALRRLSERMEDMTPVMRRIGELLVSSVQENFNREGRYSGPGSWRGGSKRWKPLSRSTIKQRERLGYWPGQILTRTGRLKSSINYHAGRDYVAVGTNLIYAAIHQFGVDKEVSVKAHRRKVRSRDIKKGRRMFARGVTFVQEHTRHMKIPARPFLVVQDEDLEEIREIIARAILKGLK